MSSDNTKQLYNIKSHSLNLINKYTVKYQGDSIIFTSIENQAFSPVAIEIKNVVDAILNSEIEFDPITAETDFVRDFNLLNQFKLMYPIPTDAIIYDITAPKLYNLQGKYMVTKEGNTFILHSVDHFQRKKIEQKYLIAAIKSNEIQFTPDSDKAEFVKKFNLGSLLSRFLSIFGKNKKGGARYTGSKSKKNPTKKRKTKKNDKRR